MSKQNAAVSQLAGEIAHKCRKMTTKTGHYSDYQAECGQLREAGVHKPYPGGEFLWPRHKFQAKPKSL